jgi:hypothetical protein
MGEVSPMKNKRPDSSVQKLDDAGREHSAQGATREDKQPSAGAFRARRWAIKKPFYIALPMWFQATTLFVLACVPIGTLAVGASAPGFSRGLENYWTYPIRNIIFLDMPLPVLALGVRFFCRFLRDRERDTAGADFFFNLGLVALALSAILLFVLFFPPVQQVRLTSGGTLSG